MILANDEKLSECRERLFKNPSKRNVTESRSGTANVSAGFAMLEIPGT